MGELFKTPVRAATAGLVLLIALIVIVVLATGQKFAFDMNWGRLVMRWLHIITGVMWIGLLWYLNFVQVPTIAKIQAPDTPAVINKYIAPNVLFYFRYGALATVITGLLLALMQPPQGDSSYIMNALLLREPQLKIGIGVWMALVMAFNVWFLIWPNQQKILGLVPASDADKAKARPIALYASRFNTMFSVGMLYFMAAQSHS